MTASALLTSLSHLASASAADTALLLLMLL
jgi:hypothetical protein